jgi:hypothetical protein
MQTVTKKVCKYQTTYCDKVVMKPCYHTVTEVCMQKQLVCRGHWECREVPACGLLSKHNRCCDPCNPCCVPTRVKKVWVNCPEYRECPVTVCKKVCTMVPTTCKVAVCTPVWSEVQCQVCTYNCVPTQVVQKYTCYETRTVPCKATRVVRTCVPYEVDVCCTRWVTRTVCQQVPCNNTCSDSCCQTTCCQTTCCKPTRCGGLFGGRGGHGHGGGNSCCCR